MGDLTGKLIANTYKDLLQIDSSATNEGLDGTLRAIQDGSGNNSSLKISETSAAFTGNVSITGNLNVGSSFTVGAVETGVLSATTIRGSTVSVTNITTDTLTAETLTFQDVSVSSLRTGNLTVTNNVTATAYYGDGSNLTGIASDSRIAAVSALTVVNQTSIAANTSLIVINQTSIAANASAVVALSATLETRIAAVSALTAVNKTSIAANASAVVALSATLETRIAAVSVLTATNKTSIAANASAVVALSATLETRIAAVSVLTATNKTSIAANAAAVVALSATLETRIAAVSVLTATNKTSIAANASAVVALSATLETRIAAVSVLTATNKTSITANASTIVALSATLESRIAALSATVATSISNYLPLTGGSLTGVVTITTGDNNPQLVLKSTDTDALSGPLLELFRDSSSPADNDLTGRISFQAEDSGSNKVTYSRINSYIDDVTDVSATGKFEIDTFQVPFFDPGNPIFYFSRIMFDGTEAVINDDGVDYDFRVESDTVANALFVQGSSGNVGIGNNSPATALDVTGTITSDGLTVDGDITFGDNDKAIFGAGSDLEIYHDGSNSIIKDGGTGDLQIKGANVEIQTAGGNRYFTGQSNVARLFHTDSEKLATTSTGIDVTGVITTDGLTTTADINFGDNDKAIFGSGSDLQIYHNAGTSFITESGSSNFKIGGENLYLQNTAHNENYLAAIANQGVTLYYNNSEKLATTTTGIDVTGDVTVTGGAIVGAGSSSAPSITASNDTDAGLFWGGGFLGFTGGSGNQMRLDNSGNLLVGTTDDVVWNNNANSAADNGHNLRDDGRAGFSYYGATAGSNATANINRTGSDGDLIRLFKSGTTVGQIGTKTGDLTIGTGVAGLKFDDGNSIIHPFSVSGQAGTNGTTDLGSNSARFRDFFLSGGVYLGGTGAANYLDDYEEGSYTVQLFDASSGGNASATSVTGYYTKIGNQVTVRFDALNNINTTGMTGANDLHFSLPFSASSTGRSAGSVIFDTLTFASGTTMVTPQVLDSASRGQFRTTGSAVTDKITEVQDINSGATDIHTLTLTYFAA